MNRTILTLALPAMLTNVATALFGLADVWVIGRLGDVTAQGGVEIGAKLITALLILFNFLRSSTVALTARAAGRNDAQAQAEVLVRAVTLALALQLRRRLISESMGHHDSEGRGWAAQRLRPRWNCGRLRCGR